MFETAQNPLGSSRHVTSGHDTNVENVPVYGILCWHSADL